MFFKQSHTIDTPQHQDESEMNAGVETVNCLSDLQQNEIDGEEEIEFKVFSDLKQIKGKKKLTKGKKKKKGNELKQNS